MMFLRWSWRLAGITDRSGSIGSAILSMLTMRHHGACFPIGCGIWGSSTARDRPVIQRLSKRVSQPVQVRSARMMNMTILPISANAHAGGSLYRHIQPHALSDVNLYTCRTPEYVLSCAQRYRPGVAGYQQFIWCAAVGERAIVFTTNPAPEDQPSGTPGAWAGNGILPQVVQHRNVLICMYRIRPYRIFDNPWTRSADYVHAWFPKVLFDAVHERNGWYIGRRGKGYVALGCNFI